MDTDRKRITSALATLPTAPSADFLKRLGKWMLVFNRVYRQPMEDATLWAYRETLSDLTPDQLDQGCREAMKNTKFTPTPAEIREYAIPERDLSPAPAERIEPLTDAEAKEFLQQLKVINEQIKSGRSA